MKTTRMRRSICATLIGGMLGVSCVISLPVATAQPPSCDIQQVSDRVTVFFQANQNRRELERFLINSALEPNDQTIADVRRWYATDPGDANDLRQLRNSLNTTFGQCMNQYLDQADEGWYLKVAFEAL